MTEQRLLLFFQYIGRKDTALLIARQELARRGADPWILRLLDKALKD